MLEETATMHIDVTQPITDYSGKPILQDSEDDQSYLRFGAMVIQAYNNPTPVEGDEATLEQKVRRGIISQEIYHALHDPSEDRARTIDFSEDEIDALNFLLNTMYTPLALMKVDKLIAEARKVL